MQTFSRMFVSIVAACSPLNALAESLVFERPEHYGPFESHFAAEGLKVVSDSHKSGQTWGSSSWKKTQWPSWSSKSDATTAESPSPGKIHLENLLIIADKSSGWSVGVFDKFKSRHSGTSSHDTTGSHWNWGKFEGHEAGGHNSPSHSSSGSPTGNTGSHTNKYASQGGHKNLISSFFGSLGKHGDHSSHNKPTTDKGHRKKLFGFTLGAFDPHDYGGSGGSHDDHKDKHKYKNKFKYWYWCKHKHKDDDPWMEPPDGGTSPAPEPSSLMLLSVGSALAIVWRRRTRRPMKTL